MYFATRRAAGPRRSRRRRDRPPRRRRSRCTPPGRCRAARPDRSPAVRRRMDAVDRADLDARVVPLPDARFSDDIGQCFFVPSSRVGRPGRKERPIVPRAPAGPGSCTGFAGLRLPAMMLLTGATGTIGSALLRRLTLAGEPVRCLVRDPRGSAISACGCRSRWATSPTRPRFATRCEVSTRSSTWRPRSAISRGRRSRSSTRWPRCVEQPGARGGAGRARDGFCSSRRWGRDTTRARASSRQGSGGAGGGLAAGDDRPFGPRSPTRPAIPLTLLERFSYLPAIPVSGSGQALYQPIWAQTWRNA